MNRGTIFTDSYSDNTGVPLQAKLFLDFLSWNIAGLKKHTDNHELLTFLSQFDIVHLSETWSDYIGEFNDLLQQYCCFDEVRNKTGSSFRNSGDNCVFVKRKFTDSLVITRLYENVCNYVTLCIDKSFLKDLYDIILVFLYISPEGSSIYNDNDLNGIELLENHLNTVKLDFSRLSFIYSR